MKVNKPIEVKAREIDAKVGMRIVKITSNVLYRVVVFNSNRTQIIDCKDDLIDGS